VLKYVVGDMKGEVFKELMDLLVPREIDDKAEQEARSHTAAGVTILFLL